MTSTMSAEKVEAKQNSKRAHWRWFAFGLIAAFLGLFVALSSEVKEIGHGEKELVAVDQFVIDSISKIKNPGLDISAMDITALGSTTVLTLVTTIFALFMLSSRYYILATHMILAGSGAGILTQLLKGVFERDRPPMISPLIHAPGFSYPSGHSLGSSAVYLTLALLACRIFKTHKQRAVILGLAACTIGTIGLSRIYLGVHYPSDVLGGTLVGCSWAFFLAAVMPFAVAKERKA